MDKRIIKHLLGRLKCRKYTPTIKINNKIIKSDCKRTLISASATVEAALVMPLYIYAVMSVMFMFQLHMVKTDISSAAFNSTRAVARVSYLYDKVGKYEESFLEAAMYMNLIEELGFDYGSKHYIVGGNAGIIINGSQTSEQTGEIKLEICYFIKNPFDIFGIGIKKVNQSFYAQSWLGEEYAAKIGNGDTSEDMVYITKYGEVYHTDKACAYLELSIKGIAYEELDVARNISGGKYYSCEACSVNGYDAVVYVTDYGERYHSKINCSKLKRIVIEVTKEAVEERRICTKCAKSN